MSKSVFLPLLLTGILFLQGSCATVRQLEDSVKKMVKGQSYDQRALVAALHQDAEKIHEEFAKTLEKLKGQIKRKWGSKDRGGPHSLDRNSRMLSEIFCGIFPSTKGAEDGQTDPTESLARV